MKRIRYLSVLLVLLCSTAAWAQDEDFNPVSPAEPGQAPDKLVLVAEPADGASSLAGGGKYLPGTSVQLGASPKSGWKFVNWTNEQGETVTSPYTKKDGKETLTAHFEFVPDSPTEPGEIAESIRYWLTLSAEEGGSVSGGGRYKAGTTNTVHVSVNSLYVFEGWYDSQGETCLSTAESYDVVMPEHSVTLLAKFRYNPPSPEEPGEIKAKHKVILKVGEGGTASATPSRLIEGETSTLRASANTGYDWDGWYSNGVLKTTSEEFTYTMGTSDVEFEARFVFNPKDPAEPSTPQAKPYSFFLMNIIGKPGDTVKFPLYFTGQIAAKDMNFQVIFPSELVPTNVNAPTLSETASGYSLECSEGVGAEEGETAFAYSLTGGEMPAGNVVLLTFDITIPEDQETGRGYPVYVNQVSVTNAEDATQGGSARHGRVSVYKNGDSNGDNFVNIADIVNVVSHTLGKSTEIYIEEVSDVNGDGDVNESDVQGIKDIIMSE